MERIALDTRRRLDRLVITVSTVGGAYGLAFVWFAIDLEPVQQRAAAAIAAMVAVGLAIVGLAYHRAAFGEAHRRLLALDSDDAPSSPEADARVLLRVQRYPQRLATRLSLIAVLILAASLAAVGHLITPFSRVQIAGVATAGAFVTFTFAVICYFRCRWIIGPALAVLVERTGRLAHRGPSGITLHLWLFSLAIAIVPLVFLGFAFTSQSLRAIETQLMLLRQERLRALALRIESEGMPVSPASFEEKLRASVGNDGVLLLVWATGEVMYQTSPGLFLDPATNKPRPTASGVYRLSESNLPAALVSRLSSGEEGSAVDIVGQRMVVTEPLAKLAPDPAHAPRLWWVFRRSGGELAGAVRLLIELGILVLVLVGTMIFIYAQTLRGPLRRLEVASQRIARGDLSRPVSVTSDDEIGDLALSFRHMHENLVRLIGRVSEAAFRVAEVARQLAEPARGIEDTSRTQARSVEDTAASIANMSASISGILASIEALREAAGETGASIETLGRAVHAVDGHMEMLGRSVESTASSIGHMATSIRQIAAGSAQLSGDSDTTAGAMEAIDQSLKQIRERADRTLGLAEHVIHDASDARSAVERATSAIDHIVQTSTAGRSAMDALQHHLEEIDQILRIQRSITGGTKLLALNATIIAARAGEGADEFGVVANEIKELSIKSRERAKDVERLVEEIRTAGRRAQEAESAGRASVEEGERRSRETGDSLLKIVDSAVLSTESVKGIALSTQEQARQSQYVRRAIQKVATGVAEISRATEEQRRGSELIQRATDEVRDYAQLVKRSALDQRHGIEQAARYVGTIREMVDAIRRSTGELDRGGSRVVRAVETIREATRDTDAMIGEMNLRVRALFDQADVLRAEVRGFRLSADSPLGGSTTDLAPREPSAPPARSS